MDFDSVFQKTEATTRRIARNLNSIMAALKGFSTASRGKVCLQQCFGEDPLWWVPAVTGSLFLWRLCLRRQLFCAINYLVDIISRSVWFQRTLATLINVKITRHLDSEKVKLRDICKRSEKMSMRQVGLFTTLWVRQFLKYRADGTDNFHTVLILRVYLSGRFCGVYGR